MDKIKVYLPENLDLEKLVDENKELLKRNKIRMPALMYICGSIIQSRAAHRKQMNEDENPFAPVNAQILDKVVHNYNQYLNFLLAQKIILTDDSYQVGVRSKGYRFNDPYDGQKLKEYDLEDYRLRKSIKRALENKRKKEEQEMKSYKYLIKSWQSKKLDIDFAGAIKWIEKDCENKIKMIDKDLKKSSRDEAILQAKNTKEDFKLLLQRIKAKEYSYKFSGLAHRFYNPLTNLKKGIRDFLRYDGQSLVSIDVKCSQPFFSLILLNPSFWSLKKSKNGEKIRFYEVIKDKDIIKKIKEHRSSIIMLLKSAETQAGRASDVDRFEGLVTSGTLYEDLQKNFSKLYPERFNERSKVKREVLRIMYSDPRKHHWPFYSPCKEFQKLFPTVFAVFKKIHSIHENLLPLLLQSIESYVMLDKVCKVVSVTYPEIPIYTIHDNLITLVGYEGKIQDVMKSTVEGEVGYKPNFGIEKLEPIVIAA